MYDSPCLQYSAFRRQNSVHQLPRTRTANNTEVDEANVEMDAQHVYLRNNFIRSGTSNTSFIFHQIEGAPPKSTFHAEDDAAFPLISTIGHDKYIIHPNGNNFFVKTME